MKTRQGSTLRGPLWGQTILVTRDADSNRVLAQWLRQRLAHVIEWPSFECVPMRLNRVAQRELKNIASYHWIVFSSRQGVISFLKEYFCLHDRRAPLMKLKIAAVGMETAKAIRQQGLKVALVAKEHSSRGLANEPVFRLKKDLRIFIPQAADARDDFVRAHQGRHHIFAAPFYRKKILRHSALAKKVLGLKVDWVLFFSPSAVESFLKHFSKKEAARFFQKTRIAVIGKTTAASVKKRGLTVSVMPQTATRAQLLRDVARHVVPTSSP